MVEVGVQCGHGGGVRGTFGRRFAFAEHGEGLVASVGAEVGDVGAEDLVDAQGVVQQQPDHRRGAQPGAAGVGVGGGDQRAALLAGQPDGGGVVRIDPPLGNALQGVRRFDEAITAHQQALVIWGEAGDRRGEGKAWNNLGLALVGARRFDEAIDAYGRDIAICAELGDHYGRAQTLENLGQVYAELDDPEQARRRGWTPPSSSLRSAPSTTPTVSGRGSPTSTTGSPAGRRRPGDVAGYHQVERLGELLLQVDVVALHTPAGSSSSCISTSATLSRTSTTTCSKRVLPNWTVPTRRW